MKNITIDEMLEKILIEDRFLTIGYASEGLLYVNLWNTDEELILWQAGSSLEEAITKLYKEFVFTREMIGEALISLGKLVKGDSE